MWSTYTVCVSLTEFGGDNWALPPVPVNGGGASLRAHPPTHSGTWEWRVWCASKGNGARKSRRRCFARGGGGWLEYWPRNTIFMGSIGATEWWTDARHTPCNIVSMQMIFAVYLNYYLLPIEVSGRRIIAGYVLYYVLQISQRGWQAGRQSNRIAHGWHGL